MNVRFRDAALIKLILITFLLGVAYVNAQFAVSEPRSCSFRYTLTGEEWLKVARINKADDKDLWHPSMTVVSSSYRPVVKKEGDVWSITFRSPNLPEPQLP